MPGLRVDDNHPWLTILGKVFAGTLAVGCGISTVAAFVALYSVSSYFLYGLSALIFSASTTINWHIYKDAVPKVFGDIAGEEQWFDGFTTVKKRLPLTPTHAQRQIVREPLSRTKKILMVIGGFLSLSVGISMAALTYAGTFKTFAFLAGAPQLLQLIAAGMLVVNLVCLTALMLNDIAGILKKTDLLGNCQKYWKKLTSTDTHMPGREPDTYELDPELAHNHNKSAEHILIERVTAITLSFVLLPIAFIGVYNTMKACTPMVTEWLSKISKVGSEGLAKLITLVLAPIGRLVFTVRNVAHTLIGVVNGPSNIINRTQSNLDTLVELAPEPQNTYWNRFKNFLPSYRTFLLSAVTTNASGYGCIALQGNGGGMSSAGMLAAFAGSANSFCTGYRSVDNILAKLDQEAAIAAARRNAAYVSNDEDDDDDEVQIVLAPVNNPLATPNQQNTPSP